MDRHIVRDGRQDEERGKCLNLIHNWITVSQASAKISPSHEIHHADVASLVDFIKSRMYVQNDLKEVHNHESMKVII